jgi:uncharacterized membrane protein
LNKVILLTFFDILVFGLGLVGYLDVFNIFTVSKFAHKVSAVLLFVPVFHVMVETLALMLGRLFHIFSYKYLIDGSNMYETRAISGEDVFINIDRPDFESDSPFPFDLN